MKDVNILKNNGVNIEKSLELFGDMAVYDETLEDFLGEVDEKLAKIKAFKESADMANYAILVHSLKSDAKYFGFEKLAELSYQHEMESKANNFYFVSDHYDELMTEANKIVALVKQYLGKETATQEVHVTTPVVHDKRILVVDDSTIIRNFIQKIFDDNYEVVVANDGQEALNIVADNINTHKNNIVGMLLDLNMPNVNGFAVLEFFKQNNLFTRIPVSIITGDNSKEIIDRAFTYPIVDVLAKPFNEINVKRIVEKTISFHS